MLFRSLVITFFLSSEIMALERLKIFAKNYIDTYTVIDDEPRREGKYGCVTIDKNHNKGYPTVTHTDYTVGELILDFQRMDPQKLEKKYEVSYETLLDVLLWVK